MTIYCCYICIQNHKMTRIPFFRDFYNNSLKYDNDHKRWSGLYAWTDDKKLYKRFKSMRNQKIFTYKKMEMDENTVEFEQLHTNMYFMLALKSFTLTDGSSSISIPLTRLEHSRITDKSQVFEAINNELVEKVKIAFDFSWISQNVLRSLDMIGFPESVIEYNFHDLVPVADMSRAEELFDRYCDCQSYSCGFGSGKMPEMSLNTINVFIYLLGDLVRL